MLFFKHALIKKMEKNTEGRAPFSNSTENGRFPMQPSSVVLEKKNVTASNVRWNGVY